jgi:adenylate cyclase
VERQGIVGDFIGDAVFAFWNTPEKSARHAFLACDAAMAQQEVLQQLRKDWVERHLPEFHIRIGINTGLVLAGNVGSDQRMKYTLIGDSVNLAARLESLGKQYGVELLVSEQTYLQLGVREGFVSVVLDIVQVVGKATGTKIMTLIARRNEASKEQLEMEHLSWEMMDQYVERNFGAALELLDRLLVLMPDHVALVALKVRVEAYVVEGVPEDWNGVVRMQSK